MEEKTKEMFDEVTKQVDKKINAITNEGIQQNNVDYLGKLVDLKKDISKIKCMESEENNMMYRTNGRGEYGTYGRGRARDSRGRYMEGSSNYNNYSGRGYDSRYRGEDMIDDMAMNYGNYMEGRESYNGPETRKALEYMLQSVEDFYKHLKEEASSPEEVEMIRRSAEKITRM